MIYLVVYDITSDKARKQVSEQLLNLGLVRAQYSVFLGTLDKNRCDELALFAESKIAKTDRLYIFAVQKADLSNARMIGEGIDQELVSDEVLTKIL
jgi:CRISPR-associated endonuclease Cas2